MSIPCTYNGKKLVASYPYTGSDRTLRYRVGRYEDDDGNKSVIPFSKKPDGSWRAGLGDSGEKRVPYNLPAILDRDHSCTIYIGEGEKVVNALKQLGAAATTSLGGCNGANKTDWSSLNGFKKVIICPDNDEAGEHYAKDVATILSGLDSPPKIYVLRLLDLPEAGDVVDWMQSKYKTWDGSEKLTDEQRKSLRIMFKEQLKEAKPVPADWCVNSAKSLPDSEWPLPNELKTKVPPVIPFDEKLLPKAIRIWAADVVYRMGVPMDYVAVAALVVISSIIGAGGGIRPKGRDNWEVICNLWGAVIAPPSMLKSPCLNESLNLLDRIQAEYGDLFEREKIGAEFEKEAKDAALAEIKSRLKSLSKKSKTNDATEYEKLKREYENLHLALEKMPVRRLFKTNETSVQSMTVLQNQNPRGVLVHRDELTGLLVKWDRDDGADERTYFLTGWNGNGSYTDYKINRGLTEAPQVCISLLGTIQPDKLKRYLLQAIRGNNDGLLQRIQLAVWPDSPKNWKLVDRTPNSDAQQAVFEIMKTLVEMDLLQYGAIKSDYDPRPYFRFAEDAQVVFNEWYTQLMAVKIKNEESPLMAEHLSKFPSLMPSLALIFHCITIAGTGKGGDVPKWAALKAVKWCDYLETHARRIYAMAANPEHETAVHLSEKIMQHKLPNPFTAKDVYDKHWRGLSGRQEVEAVLQVLIEENWIKLSRNAEQANGRPPLPQYLINPSLL